MYYSNSFQIGIPTLNRADLLIPSVQLYLDSYPDTKIWILDNGNQSKLDIFKSYDKTIRGNFIKFPVTVIKSPENIGVAASWNYLCKKIYELSEYALILNDDIFLGKAENDLNTLCSKYKFCRSTQDWAAFLISKEIYNKVGEFDSNFYPAYYEDNDYEYRMKLMGLKDNKIPQMNPIIYRTSQSIEADKSIIEKSKNNKQIYKEKWGGLPKREYFKTPYNK
jgi:GT2 family glycosyltransferase